MALAPMLTEVTDEAIGKTHRDDPVLPTSGGPAGNARLTAWTGLILLVLIAIETVTALDVRGMISWHIVVGTLLVPVALLKTFSTGWRFIRYYLRKDVYVTAGPPPMLLRLLGPLVVFSTLGVLGTGLALIAMGPTSGRNPLILGLDMLTLHQGTFIVFGVATGLHILGRTIPAWKLVSGRVERTVAERSGVPGGKARIAAVFVTLVAAVITATLVLGASTGWRNDRGGFDHFRPDGAGAPVAPGN